MLYRHGRDLSQAQAKRHDRTWREGAGAYKDGGIDGLALERPGVFGVGGRLAAAQQHPLEQRAGEQREGEQAQPERGQQQQRSHIGEVVQRGRRGQRNDEEAERGDEEGDGRLQRRQHPVQRVLERPLWRGYWPCSRAHIVADLMQRYCRSRNHLGHEAVKSLCGVLVCARSMFC